MEFTQASQKDGDYFHNLFYIYENGSLLATSRVQITLTGYHDVDGNESTTDDRTNVEYKIELAGSQGATKRNGYYRVDVKIKGLSGDRVVLTSSGTDWGEVDTQTAEIGQ